MQYLTKTLASDWVETFRGGKSKEEEEKADVCPVIQKAVAKLIPHCLPIRGATSARGNQGCVINILLKKKKQ